MSSRWRVALALLVAVAVAVDAAPAGAAYLHPTLAGSFGADGTAGSTIGNPQQLAINQTTNTLYAHANGEEKILAFNIPSTATHTPAGGAFPISVAGGGGDPDIAVDNTGGHIYFVSEGTQKLYAFEASGTALGAPFPISLPGDNCGAAVDKNGNIGEADYSSQKVNVFDPSGNPVTTIDVSPTGSPCHIEFDRGNNDLYVANYGGGVYRYTAAGGYTVHTQITSESARGLAVDATSGTVYVAFSNKVVAYNSAGAELETFATGPSEALRGIAVDESTGVVYVVDQNSGKVLVYPGVIVPDVTTGEPVSNDEVAGHIDPAGGGEVISCRVEFGETTSYGAFAPCSPSTPYASPIDVTATLPGLVGEHVYHYRFVASNGNGTNIGADRTITPHYVKSLHTDTATGVSRNCATLRGSFEGNGEDTHYFFEYGKTTSYGSTTATPPGVDAGSGNTPQNESFELCGLEPGTTYHYRIVAGNSQGTSNANDVSFTTVTAVEFLATEPAVLLSASEAVLHGSYTGNGEDTHWFFEWGYNALYGNKTAEVDEGTQTGHVPVSAQIGGLFPGTTYHFRLVGRNATGYAYGQDIAFTTGLLPEITMQPAKEAEELPDGTRAVTLRGQINPKGGTSTVYHFEYGPTESYGTSTPVGGPLPTDETAHPVGAKVTGLAAGVVYHYRLVATSDEGTTSGPDTTVQAIPNLPTVVGSSVSDISVSSGTVNATVRPGNGSTVVVIDYGQTEEYGNTTRAEGPIGSDEADHAVARVLTGLLPDTTYHYRVTAINFAGTVHGPDQTFATAGPPALLSQGAGGIGQTEATLGAAISPNLLATTYRFEYGPKGSFTGSTPESGSIGADRQAHAVSAHIGGLAAGTVYQYRVVATNGAGATSGSIGTFTTAAAAAAPKVICKKGEVLRKGKCVKKAKPKRHKKKHSKKHGGKR